MKIIAIIDMQKDFITGPLGTREAQRAVQNAVDWLKANLEKNDLVYLTKDTHYKDYLETPEGKHLPIEHCIFGTEGRTIWPELRKVIKNNLDDVFNKHTFGDYGLINTIYSKVIKQNSITAKEEDIDEIIFMGLCTDICVISNVLMMKEILENEYDVPIKVLAECCAGTTPKKHESALDVMESCQIEII